MPTSAHPDPPMWKSGMQTRLIDLSSKPHHEPTNGTSVPRFAFVSMAPLGSPVVPEV